MTNASDEQQPSSIHHSIIAHRMQGIKPSATLKLNQTAQELKKQGKKIFSLTAGEPDLPMPDHAIEAMHQAALDGKTKYTAVGGIPELKQAIIDKFYKDNDLEYMPSEVIVSTGGKNVIYNAIMSTINPGDEVIIPSPYWVSYPDIVRIAGGLPIIVDCDEDQEFKLTPEQLDKAISPSTKWLVLNSPNNPTGATYTREELIALGEVLTRHAHVLVLCDDIYEHITYLDQGFCSLPQAVPELKSRCLIVNGVSKSYSMTGLRLGFGVGPAEIIKIMTRLQSQSTSNPCSIAQHAALSALTGPQELLAERRPIYQERRDKALEWIRAIPGITCCRPEGAFYLYPSCKGIIGKKTPNGQIIETDTDFVAYLLEEAKVAAVPGSAFGLSPHFRISYATDLETIESACKAMSAAIQKLFL